MQTRDKGVDLGTVVLVGLFATPPEGCGSVGFHVYWTGKDWGKVLLSYSLVWFGRASERSETQLNPQIRPRKTAKARNRDRNTIYGKTYCT